jgi:hypothetical protein
VSSYLIRQAGAHDLDTDLMGATPGRLIIHVLSGIATQELKREDGRRFILRTSSSRIEVADDGGPRLLAERFRDGWQQRGRLSPSALASLDLLLAVDLDLAVQGASMAFDGRLYARCSLECWSATTCVRRPSFDRCAEHVAVCGACLEQEP